MTTIDITAATSHPLFDQQLALEEEMRSLGVDEFKRRIEKAVATGQETRTQAVRRLMGHAHVKTAEAIQGFIDEASSGKAGRKHTALKFVKMVDIDVAAHLTVRAVLDAISTKARLTNTAGQLALAIEDEVHFRAFEEQSVAGFNAMKKNAEKSSDRRYRRVAMLTPARGMGVELEEWSQKDRILVGQKLIELFVQATGMAQLVAIGDASGSTTPYFIEATEETLKWIDDENLRTQALTPFNMPTVVPPRPWTSPFSGGYWSNRVRRLTLLRTRNRRYLTELADVDMPAVYGAVNALQETAWAINPNVLSVLAHLWETKSTVGELPKQYELDERKDPDAPKKPYWLTPDMTKEAMTETQLEQFKDWKKAASAYKTARIQAVSQKLSIDRTLFVANKFSAFEEFYFPHTIDWRGRVYPVPLFLHPQGNDMQRGLLQFAASVPLTDDDGVLWLAIHGAGLWGVDKVDLEERREWVEQHSKEILASAEDPFENRFWAEAEKPWQALAFCYEWAGWVREGYAYESCLPVQMDGTCNGLQNLSAILRDPIGGAAVNLVPALKPNDIYARVAELVIERVNADLMSEGRMPSKKDKEGREIPGTLIREIAAGWVGNVNRKVTKRPVMTLAYGARRYGFITQVFEDTVRPWSEESKKGARAFPWAGSGYEAAQYMGALIWDCVGEVVVAAREVMEWLQEAARMVAGEGLPVMWKTPAGLPVQQNYRVPNVKRIETTFEKVVIRLTVNLEGEKIDSRKQAAGISPNWVHSLDASHMMRTIARGAEEGLRSFCMIHDSYGTHAGNAAVLAGHLREEFVAMYTETDVLADLRDQLQSQLSDGKELPELPKKGSLDLSLVLESPFFFA